MTVPDCRLQLHYCRMQGPMRYAPVDWCLPCCYGANHHCTSSQYRNHHQQPTQHQSHQHVAVVAANTFQWFKDATRCFDCASNQTSLSSPVRLRPTGTDLSSSPEQTCHKTWTSSFHHHDHRRQFTAPNTLVTSAFGPYAARPRWPKPPCLSMTVLEVNRYFIISWSVYRFVDLTTLTLYGHDSGCRARVAIATTSNG